MILTDKQLRYLGELPSSVAHALPRAGNPDVPFFLDDPATGSYELLRSVWTGWKSAKAACRAQRFSRTEYFRLENSFVKHGVAAIYPRMGARDQNPKLERIALLVKTTRPLATETAILRLSEALWIDPTPTLRVVGHVLHCHGLGNNRDEHDREFWQGLQEILRALEQLKSQPGPPHSKADRAGTFYLPEDALQARWELFRELGSDADAKVGETVRRYGISRPTFYKYLQRFRRYGPWGLVEWIQAGRAKDKASEDLEIRIIEEKLEHPRLSLDELVSRMKLKCSRTSVYDVLRFWGLLAKDRPPVRLRGLWDEEHPERPTELWRTAKEAAEAGQIDIPRKVNAHFAHLLESLRTRPLAVCEPGPIVLAQFVDDLGVSEALCIHGPKRPEGGEITYLVLLNVFRWRSPPASGRIRGRRRSTRGSRT
jgi:transposase